MWSPNIDPRTKSGHQNTYEIFIINVSFVIMKLKIKALCKNDFLIINESYDKFFMLLIKYN